MIAGTKLNQNIRSAIYGKTKKIDLQVGLPPSRAVTALEQIPVLQGVVLSLRGHTIEEFRLMGTYFVMKKLLEELEKENNE